MIRNLSDLNSSNENASCMDKVKSFWKSIPLMVKSVVVISVVLYILSWIIPKYIAYLVNFPTLTVHNFRIWSIVTTVFVTQGLINLFFAFISWVPSGINDEKENGSVAFILTFFMHSVFIQILYTLIGVFLGISTPSVGLWPYIIAEITIRCMKDPEAQMMFFFFPWPIKAKFYPWVLIGFFFLINMGSIQIDFIIAILYGYLYHYKLKSKLEFSIDFIRRWENRFPFKSLQGFDGFILLTNANSALGFTASNAVIPNSQPKPDTYEVS